MFFEMLPFRNLNRGSAGAMLLLFGLFISGCAGQPSGSDYVNPARPETYSAEEVQYDQPWPFGEEGNGD